MGVRELIIDKYDPMKNEMLSILKEDGSVDSKLEPKLGNETLKRFYEQMTYTRIWDDIALKMQRSGRMGTFAPSTGQEACQIPVVECLKKQDWLVPAFREHPAMMARGVSAKKIFQIWMGIEEGNQFDKRQNMMPPAIPVASQIPHAVGIAWAARIKKENSVSLVYFSDGATSEGDFHEGMNFAGVLKTPTVFICQNNQYAISTTVSQQTASRNIALKAIAYGFSGVKVVGNDALAMYVAANDVVYKARNGGGPAHTTADDPTRYRNKAEVKEWEKKDPILRFRLYLQSKKLWTQSYEDKLIKQYTDELNKAADEAIASEHMTTDIFDYLYVELPEHLAVQREEFEELIKRG